MNKIHEPQRLTIIEEGRKAILANKKPVKRSGMATLPGFETCTDEAAAAVFGITVQEAYRLYLLGCFPGPLFTADGMPYWYLWDLLLWQCAECPPVAEWDGKAAMEENRNSIRAAVRLIYGSE